MKLNDKMILNMGFESIDPIPINPDEHPNPDSFCYEKVLDEADDIRCCLVSDPTTNNRWVLHIYSKQIETEVFRVVSNATQVSMCIKAALC